MVLAAYTGGMKPWVPWPAVVAIVLSACSEAPAVTPKPTAKEKREFQDAALSKTPVPRSYRLDGGELKVIDVPVAASARYFESQRCFVWRDLEFKTSSISCAAAAEVDAADPHDIR